MAKKLTKTEENKLIKAGFKKYVISAKYDDDRKRGYVLLNGEEVPLETPVWLDESALDVISHPKKLEVSDVPITPYQLAQEKNITMDEAEKILEANRINNPNGIMSENQISWNNRYIVKEL